MTAPRPPYQLELDLLMPGRGEATRPDWQEVEAVTATTERESPAPTEHLMEAICDSDGTFGSTQGGLWLRPYRPDPKSRACVSSVASRRPRLARICPLY